MALCIRMLITTMASVSFAMFALATDVAGR